MFTLVVKILVGSGRPPGGLRGTSRGLLSVFGGVSGDCLDVGIGPIFDPPSNSDPPGTPKVSHFLAVVARCTAERGLRDLVRRFPDRPVGTDTQELLVHFIGLRRAANVGAAQLWGHRKPWFSSICLEI